MTEVSSEYATGARREMFCNDSESDIGGTDERIAEIQKTKQRERKDRSKDNIEREDGQEFDAV